jgi:hypothetical protein
MVGVKERKRGEKINSLKIAFPCMLKLTHTKSDN